MCARIILDAEIRRFLRRVLQADRGVEGQDVSRGRELDQGDAVAERVVNPPDLNGFWFDGQPAVEQALIKAVARTEQQLMLPWNT